MKAIVNELDRLRRRGRSLLVLQRGARVASIVVLAVSLGIATDYVLRFPMALRLMALLVAATALAGALWRYLGPAIRFKPDLTTLALRVERALPALKGRLASSVEFSNSGVDQTNPLAARLVNDTARRAEGSLSGLLRPQRSIRDLGLLAVVAGGFVALSWIAPQIASIGLPRVLTPWSGVEWPARTGVESLMTTVAVRPIGPALPLRAKVTLGDPATTRVTAEYRFIESGDAGPWRSAVLAHQSEGVHERLLDTGAGRAASATREEDAPAETGETIIEFRFTTVDAATESQEILLVDPPALRRATLLARAPAYAGVVPEVSSELGPGTDARAGGAPPILEGSTVTLEFETSKALPIPDDGPAADGWVRETLGISAEVHAHLARSSDDPHRFSVSWRLDDSITLAMNLVDAHGISNIEDIAFRLNTVADRDPAATIIDPSVDETVTPTAIVDVLAEARDDLGVGELSLDIRRRTPAGGGTSASAGATDELVRTETKLAPAEGPQPIERLELKLSLAEMAAKPGEVITLQARAVDTFAIDDRRHVPALSALRSLRVVGENDVLEQIRRQLSAIRQASMRVDAQQGELIEAISEARERGEPVERADARQSLVSERIEAQREAIESLARRLERNQVDDQELTATVRLVEDHLEAAGTASDSAAERLRQQAADAPRDERSERSPADSPQRTPEGTPAGSPQGAQPKPTPGATPESGAGAKPESKPGPTPESKPTPETAPDASAKPETTTPPDAESKAIEAEQERVRDELAQLIEMLDRDGDAWAVTRQIEKLSEEIGELQEATGELGERTVGRDRDELPRAELTELERIAAAQRDAAEQARALTDALRERGQQAANTPGAEQSGVMREAAETAAERRLAEQLEQGAREVDENQMARAQERQQAAREALEEMLEDLREGRKARTRELQRQLASLVESIQRLVAVQEDELIALAKVEDPAALDERGRSMIRLKQTTDSVVIEARTAGAETERIARLLGRAAEAQGDAIRALRTEPATLEARPAAIDGEERSLAQLKEALALSKETQERVEQEAAERARQQLLERYRTALEREVAILEQTGAAAREPSGRRQLLEARRLAGAQTGVREQLDAIRSETESIGESRIFTRAHDLMDGWSKLAEERLDAGDVGPKASGMLVRVAGTLEQLIAALAEQNPEEEPFEQNTQPDQGGGEGGGQGSPPVIPPRSELVLLRGLQEQLYRETRLTDEAGLAGTLREETLRELGERQKELADLAQQMLQDLAGDPGMAPPSATPPPAPPRE